MCFLPRRLRLTLLPKQRCADSLSGPGLLTEFFDWEADTTTELSLQELLTVAWVFSLVMRCQARSRTFDTGALLTDLGKNVANLPKPEPIYPSKELKKTKPMVNTCLLGEFDIHTRCSHSVLQITVKFPTSVKCLFVASCSQCLYQTVAENCRWSLWLFRDTFCRKIRYKKNKFLFSYNKKQHLHLH